MRIGGAWTYTSEKTGKTFISAAFDKEFLELCPQLKNCGLMLNYVSKEDRKNEKAPSWTLNLVKNDDSYKKRKDVEEEQRLQESESPIKDEEIPF